MVGKSFVRISRQTKATTQRPKRTGDKQNRFKQTSDKQEEKQYLKLNRYINRLPGW